MKDHLRRASIGAMGGLFSGIAVGTATHQPIALAAAAGAIGAFVSALVASLLEGM